MLKFSLTKEQAAGIVGNLGTETRSFTANHEAGQRENKGGYGWGQWTGPRRDAFFKWADDNKLERDSEAASLGFLEHELQTTHSSAIVALKREVGLSSATKSFMIHFERPGILNEGSRQAYAVAALNAYNLSVSEQEKKQ